MVASPAEGIAAPNPVRRVLTMLQMMQKKVVKEGKSQHALFDKYVCYAKTRMQKLKGDIELGKDMVPQLQGAVEEAVAEKGALENDVRDARAEFAEAEKALGEATSMRAKENKDFTAEDAQMKVDLEGLKKAVKAMDKLAEQGEGSLLQTGTVATIRRLVATSADLTTSDRDIVTNFLSESESDEDGVADGLSQSSPGEITGILKQMLETMTKDNLELKTGEKNALKQFESLRSAKESQKTNLKKDISTKTDRIGKLGLQIVEDQGKLEDTKKSLESNNKLFAGLTKDMKARSEKFDLEEKTRTEELVAITDTVKILNDELAHKLFKKTMATDAAVSFLQLKASPKHLKGVALKTLLGALPKGEKDPRLDFLALALRSKKTSFSKVLQMIDDMVKLLTEEQKNDADKKKYCESEITQTDDEKKELDQTVVDLKKAVDLSVQKSKSLTAEIKLRSDSVKLLDKQVADATQQRKEENQDFMENLQANNGAKDILGVAKARLAKFYGSEVVKAQKLLQIESRNQNQFVGQALRVKRLTPAKPSSDDVAPLSDNGKASLSRLFDQGVLSFAQVDVQTQVENSDDMAADPNPVVGLISTIIADIEKEVQEMTSSEKNAQSEYEVGLKESAEKRAEDAKAISQLEGFKAQVQAELHEMKGNVESKTKESEGKANYLKDLHKECDWLLQHFKTRNAARTGEIDALQKAKAVLSGADAGFLQLSMRTWRGLRSVEKHV